MILKSQTEITFDKNVMILFLLPLVLVGKFIRYTVMKTVLVDAGIGYSMLQEILYGAQGFTFFSSESSLSDPIGNSAVFYRLLNIFYLTTYQQFEIMLTLLFNLILILIICGISVKLSLGQLLFLMLSIIVLNIFDFTLAKEPIQMLYFTAIYLVLISKSYSNKAKNICIVIILLLSSATFRSYYILIAFFTVFAELLYLVLLSRGEKHISFATILFIIACLGLVYYILLNAIKVVSPTNFVELIRVRTRDSEAASGMRNLLPSSNLVFFVLDYILMLIRMLIPIELVPLGVKYLPYVIYQFAITYYLYLAIKNLRTNRAEKNLAVYVFLGFLLGSAAFEPDFGSWIRHETVLFPLFLLIVDATFVNQKKLDADSDIHKENVNYRNLSEPTVLEQTANC